MLYNSTIYDVFIASPSDVQTERKIAREIIYRWNNINTYSKNICLLPFGWELDTYPAIGTGPQKVVNDQLLERADLLIGIFGSRIGTQTEKYLSGTVEEIEKHILTSKPTMLYFSDEPIPRSSINFTQLDELKNFKEKCESKGLIHNYSSPEDFKEKLRTHLDLIVNQDKYFKSNISIEQLIIENNTKSPTEIVNSLTEIELILLSSSMEDPNGKIHMLKVSNRFQIDSNHKNLILDPTPRIERLWKDALDNLIDLDIIEDVTQSKTTKTFALTTTGYKICDLIKSLSMDNQI